MNKSRPIILIVEDNPDNAFVVTELITRRVEASYVDSMVSGQNVLMWLERYPHHTPDLILIDIQIPGEDGYTVLRRLREHPQLQNTVMAALTANILTHNVDRAREAGFHGFIGKPIDPLRFPQQIKRLLQGEVVWEPRS